MKAALALAAALLTVALAEVSAPAATRETLENQKLEQEIRKLKLESDRSTGVRGFLSSYATLITALAAIAGVLVTYSKQRTEDRTQQAESLRQREAEREQRDREIEQRAEESERRLADRFVSILGDLGADSEAVRAGAAVSLLNYARPENRSFHHQLRLATLANLKVEHTAPLRRLLRSVLESALRTDEPIEPVERDLSAAHLAGADLAGLDLDGATLDDTLLEGANLSGASLREARGNALTNLQGARCSRPRADKTGQAPRTDFFNARLPGARCARANFDGANLVNAHFEGADLSGAKFRGATMQAAHFRGAVLTGAAFSGANVNGTIFTDAVFDDGALQSLAKAVGKPRLSPTADKRLKELAADDR